MKFQRFIYSHTNPITFWSAGLIILGFLNTWFTKVPYVTDIAWIIASVIAAAPIVLRAISALKAKVFSIELLVGIAVIGAFAIGEFEESAIVTFLFLFGSYLEQKTLAKTRGAIQSLTEMAPTTAQLVNDDGTTEEVDVDDLEEGNVVLVKAGGQVPVDGKIVDGSGYVNEASITGESRPINKQNGDGVYSGAMVESGTLTIEATQVGDETTFSKIIELVEEAQDTKSPAEKFIDKFAQYYTPAVLVIAILVFIFSRDLRLAITVLVLGCPGALVIGAPVSNVAGIGNGAKNGILIKGGDVVESLAKVDTIVFDKTGTLTTGKMTVADMKQYTDDHSLLAGVAQVEKTSDHPLAQAIVAHLDAHLKDNANAIETETVKGRGMIGHWNDNDLYVGNAALLKDHDITLTDDQQADLHNMQDEGQSTVLVGYQGQLAFILGVADTVRPEVPAALAALKRQGIKHLVMLTGDNQATAQAVAESLGIDEVHADLLPADKVTFVKKFQDMGRNVAFVGDGINDSPSLATASVGIAMGGGTDVAIETADVVLMQSSFTALNHAVGLAKKTSANTKQNITIAILTVAFLLIGLVYGYIYMASGMFVHEASILVVIFNAMRLIGYKPRGAKQAKPAAQQLATN
ncbi:MAG: heavy metal translocating P-type ATPase [Levilactobacillus sp.]|jgi:Cd2+/Zn2+-exporting ATPase|uniref:heavy metal translocating P-type ATPase n=1 Tax=Levilactobacillus sp. TaxID=2767919 RepID=UPI00258EB588|nr:heavy metal translocating P-type ATPase [Levilactobacillus sp.]MCI1552851.1 heavy metal translocating P-type ATPase [Levilactobacillus sp.]MCI1597991.1 heavy metal translocating P-type ATPase [Levilactobacillus sp.]MCI1605953.1 heavy metal translocating P-type ATPase [Levilactobacillus sp.]